MRSGTALRYARDCTSPYRVLGGRGGRALPPSSAEGQTRRAPARCRAQPHAELSIAQTGKKHRCLKHAAPRRAGGGGNKTANMARLSPAGHPLWRITCVPLSHFLPMHQAVAWTCATGISRLGMRRAMQHFACAAQPWVTGVTLRTIPHRHLLSFRRAGMNMAYQVYRLGSPHEHYNNV